MQKRTLYKKQKDDKNPSNQQTGNYSKVRLLIAVDFLYVQIFIAIETLKLGTQILNCVRIDINTLKFKTGPNSNLV